MAVLPRSGMPGQIDQVSAELGKLSEQVMNLRREVSDLRGDVAGDVAALRSELTPLTTLKNRGAGILVGISFAFTAAGWVIATFSGSVVDWLRS